MSLDEYRREKAMTRHYWNPRTVHGHGNVGAWWIRWHEAARPGCYVFTLMCNEADLIEQCQMVTDDFGNLVRVH